MAIISGVCWSFKEELLRGTHAFQTDTIKAALYTSSAALVPADLTAYTASGEATGTNWAATGVALPVSSGYPAIDERTGRALVAFDEVEVENVTVTFRAVLIYNASKANRAIMILDRGIDVILTAGPLVLRNLVIPIS
jgi:hypothetical protein